MPSALRLLIVEDEPLYALRLSLLAQGLGYLPLGPVDSAEAALELLGQQAPPDVAVLDINLAGELDGVDLARELLGRHALPLIFVTSLRDEATFQRAKLLGPAAFLVKPFDERTLEHAIELALHNFAAGQQARAGTTPDEPLLHWAQDLVVRECLFLRERGRLTKVCIEDIGYVEAGDKYCVIVTAAGRFAARLSLRELARELPAGRFVQTHRSYLVNADRIEQIDPPASQLTVQGATLPLGRAYRDSLLQRLRLIG